MASPYLCYIADLMRTLRYREATIKTYLYWIKFYIILTNKKHPNELGNSDVERFLSFLANQRNVAPKTQSIALNAIVFLYKKVVKRELCLTLTFNQAKTQRKLPTVLTPAEIRQLFDKLKLPHLLLAQLMYGSGLRKMEAMRLRVKDIDCDNLGIEVWDAKRGKNRRVTLAKNY